MSDKLKLDPCKHCGREVKVCGGLEEWTPSFYDPDSGGKPYFIKCECGISLNIGCCDYSEIVTAWNRRPTPHKYTVEELRELPAGTPVWTVTIGLIKSGRWELIEFYKPNYEKREVASLCNIGEGLYDCFADTYNKTWVAYDREPEGEI